MSSASFTAAAPTGRTGIKKQAVEKRTRVNGTGSSRRRIRVREREGREQLSRSDVRRVLCSLPDLVNKAPSIRRGLNEIDLILQKTAKSIGGLEKQAAEVMHTRYYMEQRLAKRFKNNDVLWDGSNAESLLKERDERKRLWYATLSREPPSSPGVEHKHNSPHRPTKAGFGVTAQTY